MNASAKRIIAGLAAGALIVPAAALAKPGHGGGHGQSSPKHESHGKGKARNVPYVFGGTVASVDTTAGTVTVNVVRGNHWARALKGQQVTFDASKLRRVHVRDFDGNGTRDLADVQANDRVIVKARLPKAAPGDQPFVADQFVDVTKTAAAAPAPDGASDDS